MPASGENWWNCVKCRWLQIHSGTKIYITNFLLQNLIRSKRKKDRSFSLYPEISSNFIKSKHREGGATIDCKLAFEVEDAVQSVLYQHRQVYCLHMRKELLETVVKVVGQISESPVYKKFSRPRPRLIRGGGSSHEQPGPSPRALAYFNQ